jgi:ATP-dependent DNA helicase RecQ
MFENSEISLRPFQKEALKKLRQSVHLLCIASTGSGKSLIYETVASEPGRRTLLISPLVALARQQARRLEQRSVSVALHSGANPKPSPPLGSGVWIISPESLTSASTQNSLRRWRPDFLVVDECHCLYEWGDRFRTSFHKIPGLISTLEIPRSLWLTATLPPEARTELEKSIGFPLVSVGSFSLPTNLFLELSHVPWICRAEFLLAQVTGSQEPGIVFVSTRDATRRVQNLIQAAGRRALIYHAGMSYEERIGVERAFRSESEAVLIATSAFGMGMDYAHPRWSILWQPPSSLLALAQALGRVGRNRNRPARATVFWDEEDFRSLEWLTLGSPRQARSFEEVKTYLQKSGCRRHALQVYFNPEGAISPPSPSCESCDYCYPGYSNHCNYEDIFDSKQLLTMFN